jgi:SagB-type dehydrogenase family enzyme
VTTTGKEYHRLTSYHRQRMSGHALDWTNQPSVYKEYRGLGAVSLPRPLPLPETGLSGIVLKDPEAESEASFSLPQLSQIFFLAYGLTGRSVHPGGEFFYRSVPSAGALYPCELYVAARSILDLPDGLYHYAVGRHSLVPLRSGDELDSLLPSASADRGPGLTPRLIFFVTAIFFRSAWKYRARSYRYHLLDTGHLVENLELSLKAFTLNGEVTFDFNDQDVNSFLGCDPEREVCLALVSVGQTGPGTIRIKAVADLPESAKALSRVSPKEITYPVVHELHGAGSRSISSKGEVPAMGLEVGALPDSWKIVPRREAWPEEVPFGEAVVRRRSQRNFVKGAISEDAFQAFVTLLCAGSDTVGGDAQFQQQTVALGFLAGNVEGLDPGCYWLDHSHHRIGMTRSGDFTARMAHLCLDQEWLAQASLHCFFATNLELLDEFRGPRGYRYAMLMAGRLGQRIYLGATSFGLGCCGIGAFYDEEAAALLGLNPSSVMLYLLAVGPVKRAIR